jgi:integrase
MPKRISTKAIIERAKKAAKIIRLVERAGSPGEQQAAEAALKRLGVTPDDAGVRRLAELAEWADELTARQKREVRHEHAHADTPKTPAKKTSQHERTTVRKRLTEEGVAKLKKPATGHIDYFDTGQPGLILRLNYGRAKTWLVRHYLRRVRNGKAVSVPTTTKLGRYPTLKVKEARERARLFDPKAKAEAQADSFREIAENFVKRYVETEKKLRTKDEIVDLLDRLIYPHWELRPFREIKRAEVAALLDHIVDHHGARQADKALAIIRKMGNWFATRDSDYISPVVKGMGRYNAAARKRDRILNDDEIRSLWGACADAGTFGALLKTLLLTGARREKVLTMRWEDVSDGVWTIPTAPREKPNAGTLKLPQAVLDIINAQPRIAGNPYVFFGRGSGPFNSFSQRKVELAEKLKIAPWVVHDLRRTAKTLMAKAGVRPDISERVLGHTIQGVEGVYDRHTYDAEKADALNVLAALVERIVNPPEGNVVPLTKAAKRKASRIPAKIPLR